MLTLMLVPHPGSLPPADVADDAMIDYIHTKYHPGSGKATRICPYEEHDSSQSLLSSAHHITGKLHLSFCILLLLFASFHTLLQI